MYRSNMINASKLRKPVEKVIVESAVEVESSHNPSQVLHATGYLNKSIETAHLKTAVRSSAPRGGKPWQKISMEMVFSLA